MAEMTLFTGRKGGTGKTTVCAATAGRLATQGRRVLVVEAIARTMDMLYDVADKVLYDWRDANAGRCLFEAAVVPVIERGDACLHLLCASVDEEVISASCVEQLVQTLGPQYDHILVDIDAMEEEALDALAEYATRAVIVTTPDRSSVRRNAKASEQLFRAGVKEIRLCINQLTGDFLRQTAIPDLDWMIDTVCAQLIAIIPFDPNMPTASDIRYLVESTNKNAVFFDNLAQRIMGNHIDLSVW